MEQTVKLGLAKDIGVSNFNEEQLERLLKNSTIKPVINQFEVSKYRNIDQTLLRKRNCFPRSVNSNLLILTIHIYFNFDDMVDAETWLFVNAPTIQVKFLVETRL